MSDHSLWARIRNARLFQILAVYLGVSWVILQVVGELREALDLPPWIGPVSLILLVIGFFTVLATAWVQSHPVASRPEGAEPSRGSWDVALGELKESLSRGELPRLTWGRAVLGGVFAFSLLFGLAGVYVVVRDRGRSFAPDPALAEDAAPGIAVLPFTVTDPGLEEWREGMVNILSTNLDGAGGLRAIDSRTVLARWDEHAGQDARADLQGSLEVARAAGARHALLGSVVSGGRGLRLTADVYDVESGTALDHAMVEGPVDSIFSLVDRLSIQVLQAILPDVEGEFTGVGLARMTTSSVAALRAFLEGEALFRRGRFDASIPAYERAVEADSTFALAYARLSNAYGWAESISSDLGMAAAERAARYANRLPERERILVEAEESLVAGTLDGMEALRLAVRRYPDDPEAWYLLGDTYFHLGDLALVPRRETEAAFLRAVELDPDFTPAYIHLADMAFRIAPDSALARARIDRYGELAPGTSAYEGLELAFALAYGDSASRALATAALDTATTSLPNIGSTDLLQGWFIPGLRAVTAELERRRHSFAPVFRFYTEFQAGQFDAATNALGDAAYPAVARLADLILLDEHARYLGIEPPAPPWANAAVAAAVADTADPAHALAGGIYAAMRGDEAGRGRALTTLRAAVGRLRDEGDEVGSRFADGGARALEGFAAWRRGDPETAASLLDEARLRATSSSYPAAVLNDAIRWWQAGVAADVGRDADAARYLESLWLYPVPELRLGRLYDEMGDTGKALDAYRYFLSAWYEPGPGSESLVEEVRQRVAALMDAP